MTDKNNLRNIPVKYLKGIGDFRASLLEKLGVFTINDLLEFFPKQYIRQSLIYKIKEDDIDKLVSFSALIVDAKERTTNSGKVQFIVSITDGESFIDCIWFQYGKWMLKDFEAGSKIWVSGILGTFNGVYQLIHPQYEVIKDENMHNDFWKNRTVLPVYKLTGNLSQTVIRNAVYNAFEKYLE